MTAVVPHRTDPRPAGTRGPQASLEGLLRAVFRHDAFRGPQRDVCEAVARGEDVLLVMPTGAGKSLCYQLPGLAREGTTLVVSPLVALIEDQVAKLQALGLRAERIHSGRDRMASREVCRRYLAGDLDFLFIAPERLAVAGFPEMLAKRPLGLVAIDEAHCISHWGHDFRPEYRMLGQRLPLFRPAPIVALTATATPAVQDDICEQLALPKPRRFIQGFRRDNLALEVLSLLPTRRAAAVVDLLSKPEQRPAIVYTNTRAGTEDLAGALLKKKIRAAAYHAGMPAETRESVQRGFSSSEIDVVVATVAFGMGIDKGDVRLVVHAGIPQSLEGYYQEIGRAGRDGKPSRAVLFHSYADVRMHEFLLAKSYPELEVLDAVYTRIGPRPIPQDVLAADVDMDGESFEKALDQLFINGGIAFDAEGAVLRGDPAFRKSYTAQRAHRFGQLKAMLAFADGHGCRMQAIIRHFGDAADDGGPCGLCDACRDSDCIAKRFRDASTEESKLAADLLEEIGERSRPMGQLFRRFGEALGRDAFAHVVDGLVRRGVLAVEQASFEKEGKTVAFQRLRRVGTGGATRFTVLDDSPRSAVIRREKGAQKSPGEVKKLPDPKRPRPAPESGSRLEVALRAWRREEAKTARLPAFRILTDRTLAAIAEDSPATLEALGACAGVGKHIVKKYGTTILEIIEASC